MSMPLPPHAPPQQPDTISIDEFAQREVDATGADVFVTISGASLVSGASAHTKSKEVAKLADDLRAAGVPASALRVQGVSAQVSSGLLVRSSSATFSVRVRCDDLEKLPEVLGIVAAQKNTSTDSISWRYPNEHDLRREWAKELIERANIRANVVSQSLGVSLLGVHHYEESLNQGAFHEAQAAFGGGMPMRSRAAAPLETGMPLAQSREYTLRVLVRFRVGQAAAKAAHDTVQRDRETEANG